MLRSVLSLEAPDRRTDRPAGLDDDVCFSPELVATFLEEYSQPGDLVFDPFAGFGTTLAVAQRMGRRALGLEILPDRVAYVRTQLAEPSAIIEADARQIRELELPRIDFTITSPPYMTRTNHPQNPLTGYRTLDGDYQRYLDELADIYRHIDKHLSDSATVVVNAANLRHEGAVTRLAWDIANSLSNVLEFEREIVLDWNVPMSWLTNDYCLVFRPRR